MQDFQLQETGWFSFSPPFVCVWATYGQQRAFPKSDALCLGQEATHMGSTVSGEVT